MTRLKTLLGMNVMGNYVSLKAGVIFLDMRRHLKPSTKLLELKRAQTFF